MSIRNYEYKREQALTARREAEELTDLHLTATCGLDLRMNYGTRNVPAHIARRIANSYPIWAAEYLAIAERLENEMEAMIR
jgi:hypothetical protein